MNSGPERLSVRVTAVSGTGSPLRVPYIELVQVTDVCTVIPFGLYIHLPLSAEAVEIIYELPAHKRLQRPINVPQIHALAQHFVAVHVNKILWHVWQKGCKYLRELGPLLCRFNEFPGVVRQEPVCLCPHGLRE